MCFLFVWFFGGFFCFVFEALLKDFLFYPPIILTVWFRHLQTRIKESCMYLSSQLFFKTPHETLKFKKKIQEKCIFRGSADLSFKNILFGPYHGGHPHGVTELSKQ